MNLDRLTDQEFLNWLHVTGFDDPIVKRMWTMCMQHDSLRDDLIAVKMDAEENQFYYNGLAYSPAEYIQRLEQEIDSLNDEGLVQQEEIDNLQLEIHGLKARSVAELIAELHEDIKKCNQQIEASNRAAEKARLSEQDARSRLDMWGALNKEYV